MKLLKIQTLIVLLLVINSQIQSKPTSNNIKLANQHIKFIDQLTDKLIKTQGCLLSLYGRLEGTRQQQYYVHIGTGYVCANFLDERYFEELLVKTKNTATKNGIILNTHAKKLYDAYLNINNLSRELEIYVRLGDYKKDQAKKTDEIFPQLISAYDEYIMQKNIYYQYLVEIMIPFTKKTTSKANKAYFGMHEFIMNEEKLLSNLKINFCSKTFTAGLPTDLLLQQIKESDDRIAKIKSNYSKIAYSFNSTAENQIQKTKREAIDRYSIDARKSDGYTNGFIKNYRLYLNHYLIRDFNKFVESSGIELLRYPRIITALKIDYTEKEFVPQIVKYQSSDIPEIVIIKQATKISKRTAEALNNYIEFINNELHYNHDFASKLFYLNKSANKQLEKNTKGFYLSFNYYDKYALPTAAYEKTINESKYINSNYTKALNLLLKELMEIITEKYQLVLALDKYVEKKKFREDRFEKLYIYLERFEYLINMFDKRKQELYEYTRQIAESFQITRTSPWNIGRNEMLKQADASLITLNIIKNELMSNSLQKVQVNKINQISRDLLIKEYDNLKGLKKIGRNHGHCPYNPYEDIAKTASYFAEKTEKFPNTEYIKRTSWHKYYRDFVYQYNDMIQDYNKFAWLAAGGYDTFKSHQQAPVFHIKNVRQLIPYRLTLPEIKEITEVIEPQKDTSSISMDGFAANNLVLLLDVSGSMRAEDKLPLLRASFLEILPHLRNEDEIAIVAFSGKGKVLLRPISCSKKEKITEVLESLESKGQTNFDKGLKLAYKTAKSNFKPEANNRIIVATDGAFSIDEEMYKLSENESDKKIFLSVFSFGHKDKKVKSLGRLANKGKGSYEYIELSNATKKLLRELQALKVN